MTYGYGRGTNPLLTLGLVAGVGAGILGLAYCVAPQHSSVARYVPGVDARYTLDERCEDVIATGISIKKSGDDEVETRWVDCRTKDDQRLLSEFSNWGIFEADYTFSPEKSDAGIEYQGGWGSRLFGGDQVLPVPSDCADILNVGKSGAKKFIVCEAPDATVYMREFSDWGAFEATYVFGDESQKDMYQGGWFSRLGGKAQHLPVSDQCSEINSAGRSGSKKYVDCILENGDHMLQEFTDFGVFEANYIFSKDAEGSFYQGGWGSRLGGEAKMLKLPDECVDVLNVGRAGGFKTVTCTTNEPGKILMHEYSDFGVFQADHYFKLK